MLRKQADKRPSAKELEEVLHEMAAAVVPNSARPSAKLKTVAPQHSSSQWDSRDVGPQNHSTLGHSAAQVSPIQSSRVGEFLIALTDRSAWLREHASPRQRLIGIGASALIIMVAITCGIVFGLRKPDPPVVAKPVEKVRWLVNSIPAGVHVVRTSDQTVLGQTPWTNEQDASTGKVELLLRLEGYKERTVFVDRSRNTQLLEKMEAVAPPDANAISGGRKKGKKSTKVEGEEDPTKRGKHRRRVKLID